MSLTISTISNELVSLSPDQLDKNIQKHLTKKLIEMRVGKCSKEFGFIKEVEIKNVKAAEISMTNGTAQFSITYSIKSLLPQIGESYTSKMVMVISNENVCCAIAMIDNSCEDKPFNVFISNGFITKDNHYSFENCKCLIPVTGQLESYTLENIKVVTVEYYEQQFIVTGEHVHNSLAKND
jgi:DNA-directed RNA polymerase subunit E'/Rpb7